MSIFEAVRSETNPRPEKPVQNPHAIKHISVEGLFGQYEYEIPLEGNEADLSRLMILCGENGSGKTTLLKMLYRALSPERDRGHRTFLAGTKFKRFEVNLQDGTAMEIVRNFKKTRGTLEISLQVANKPRITVKLPFDQEMSINSRRTEEGEIEFFGQLQSLGIRLHYLSDDRKNENEGSHQKLNVIHRQRLVWASQPTFFDEIPEDMAAHFGEEKSPLDEAIQRVLSWAQAQVRQASAKGQESVYSIYSKVVSDITHSHETQYESPRTEANRLINTLFRLQEESEQFSRYGLTPPLTSSQELINNLKNATEETLPIICNVVRPHVGGIEARLKALSDIYNTIDQLVQTLNNFYRNKMLSFSIDRGFEIWQSKGKKQDPLNPNQLSSGEKQLFLLLCHTVLARKHASLFLIDEPELSLNVKWQRQLVQALLDNSEGSNVQFLLATHSLELITQHRSHIVQLIDKTRQPPKKKELENGGVEE